MKVICPVHVKTIRLDLEWRAEVTVRQTLVFLDARRRGLLHDACIVDPGTELERFAWRSDDGKEIGRRRRGKDTIIIDWLPRDRVVPLVLYEHQYSWHPSGLQSTSALCIGLHCDLKTGLFQCEIVAPHEFEAAVVLERPRWWFSKSERSLIKSALKRLEGPGERPAIVDGGRRIEWKLLGPKVGAGFVLVVFRLHGIAMWQDQIRKTSFFGRARQLVGLSA
jgi:hypothetical protein